MKLFTQALGLCMLFACTQDALDKTPMKVLDNYIQISFHATSIQDKRAMENLLTGDTKNRLVSWSDEQFTKAFISPDKDHPIKKFLGLKTLEEKKVNDREYALTYELSYQEGPEDKIAQITERKLATIVDEDATQNWRIKEVRSIRESIEYLKELSLP